MFLPDQLLSAIPETVLNFSITVRIELRWHLKGCKVPNDLHRLRRCFSLFHISVTTPDTNCKSPTLGRRWLQIRFVKVDNILLSKASDLFSYLYWPVIHIPGDQHLLDSVKAQALEISKDDNLDQPLRKQRWYIQYLLLVISFQSLAVSRARVSSFSNRFAISPSL